MSAPIVRYQLVAPSGTPLPVSLPPGPGVKAQGQQRRRAPSAGGPRLQVGAGAGGAGGGGGRRLAGALAPELSGGVCCRRRAGGGRGSCCGGGFSSRGRQRQSWRQPAVGRRAAGRLGRRRRRPLPRPAGSGAAGPGARLRRPVDAMHARQGCLAVGAVAPPPLASLSRAPECAAHALPTWQVHELEATRDRLSEELVRAATEAAEGQAARAAAAAARTEVRRRRGRGQASRSRSVSGSWRRPRIAEPLPSGRRARLLASTLAASPSSPPPPPRACPCTAGGPAGPAGRQPGAAGREGGAAGGGTGGPERDEGQLPAPGGCWRALLGPWGDPMHGVMARLTDVRRCWARTGSPHRVAWLRPTVGPSPATSLPTRACTSTLADRLHGGAAHGGAARCTGGGGAAAGRLMAARPCGARLD